MSSGPKYPNQQLRSVSLEAYFPGQLGVYRVLGDIQAAVSERLPNLFVPNLNAGEAAALRPFQMRDVDQRRSLAVAVNQVAFVSFDYPGFEVFSKEALPVIRMVLEHIKQDRLNRVTYRYENEVGIARDTDGFVQLQSTFPGIVPKVFAEDSVRAANASYEHSWVDGSLRGTRGFHARIEDERGLTVLKLTVFGSLEAPHVNDLHRAVDVAHRVGFHLFESLISDSFRTFISANKEE